MKKLIVALLLIISISILTGCSKDYIIDESRNGITPPDLNITYNSASNTIMWNPVANANEYHVQINTVSKTTEYNVIKFQNPLKNGIYTVVVTPENYKPVIKVITVGFTPDTMSEGTIVLITAFVTVLIIAVLLTVAFIIIKRIKNKNADTEDPETDIAEFNKDLEENLLEKENEIQEKIKEAEIYKKNLMDIRIQASEALAKNAQLKKEIAQSKKDFNNTLNELNRLKATPPKIETVVEEKIIYQQTKEQLEELNEVKSNLEEANKKIEELKNAPPQIEKVIEREIIHKPPTPEQMEEIRESIKQEFEESLKKQNKDFRQFHPTKYRSEDGHPARSKSEKEIDNFFFSNHIRHIYECKYYSPLTKKEYIPDFYLPDYNLYIEYFGKEDEKYKKSQNEKMQAYKADTSIKFAYLDYNDDYDLISKLQRICREHNIPLKH